jgi:flagellar motility protein MotE (MotC chaperone)
MSRFMREFRLVPLVVFATASLLALKIGGLATSGGYTLASPRQAQADDLRPRPTNGQRSWAQEMFGYPDITGSVEKPAAADKDATGAGKTGDAKPGAPAGAPPPRPEGASGSSDGSRLPSGAERAVLERLQERRQELEQRAREIDIRESLMNAAEMRLEAKLIEIREIEARITAASARKDEEAAGRIKGLVTMYENMKAKDAARIFDRLDMRILIEVTTQINPRRMSDILAQMSSEAAERLTVELATRSQSDRGPLTSDLPKIEGRPGG